MLKSLSLVRCLAFFIGALELFIFWLFLFWSWQRSGLCTWGSGATCGERDRSPGRLWLCVCVQAPCPLYCSLPWFPISSGQGGKWCGRGNSDVAGLWLSVAKRGRKDFWDFTALRKFCRCRRSLAGGEGGGKENPGALGWRIWPGG